jgi:flagellar hook-length control protein FliK
VLGIGARAEVRGELPPQEKVTAPDAQIEPESRAPDDAAPKQQTASTPQIGRLPHFSGSTGNGAAVPHPAIVTPGDLGQAVVRPPDGVTVGPGPYPATEEVALQINKALDESRTEIRIRLDPPELGEVDVHLEFRELRLTATVSAERPDTLDLLQRDARTLARALRDAGVELADADLSFAHNGRGDRPDAGAYAQRAIGLPRALAAPAPLQDLSRALRGAGGFVSLSEGRMDLRV